MATDVDDSPGMAAAIRLTCVADETVASLDIGRSGRLSTSPFMARYSGWKMMQSPDSDHVSIILPIHQEVSHHA
jgi:hypothetical protein